MTSCQTFYCTNEKGKCEKNCFFFVITDQDYPCQHIDQLPRKTRQHWRQKNVCTCIKQVKNGSYLIYGQSCKTYGNRIMHSYPPKYQ